MPRDALRVKVFQTPRSATDRRQSAIISRMMLSRRPSTGGWAQTRTVEPQLTLSLARTEAYSPGRDGTVAAVQYGQ